MSAKTTKLKTNPFEVITSKNGTPANGTANSSKPKKSMYQKWIEKYGVDDTESGRLLIRAWHKTYDNHNKKVD